MSDSNKAVFLSYASQDAEAAKRICEALRAAGVEVWFDQSELRGGDAWDAKIRKQIKDCSLFVPVISAAAQARREGYFRIEWKLAAQRTHAIAEGTPFLLPVAIDDTVETEALVPAEFREVQWTRLRDDDALSRFCVRLPQLLDDPASQPARETRQGRAAPAGEARPRTPGRTWAMFGALAALAAVVILALTRPWSSAPPPNSSGAPERFTSRTAQLAQRLTIETRDELDLAVERAAREAVAKPDSAAASATRARLEAQYVVRGWDVSEQRRQDTQAHAKRALVLDPNSTDAMFALAIVLLRQGAFAEAETLVRTASARQPDDAELRQALGTALSGQGREAEALSVRQENLRLFPRNPFAHYDLALSFESASPPDLEAALRKFDDSLALQRFTSTVLHKASLLAGWRGDLVGARRLLDELDPLERTGDRAVGVTMAVNLLDRRPERAIEVAGLTARNYLDDDYVRGPKAWLLAHAQTMAGRQNLALAQWREAEAVLRLRLRASPGNWFDEAGLAITLAWLGEHAEAARLVTSLESLARESPDPQRLLYVAYYYAGLGDAAKVADCLQSVLNRRELVTVKTLPLDPWWNKVRGKPEFDRLLAAPSTASAGHFGAAVTPVADKSIAVLAFDNLSDDKANEYFSDGISEELLNVLAKVPGLKVTARTSAFSFKGKGTSIAEVARQLGVAYVIEGSVRKAGSQVRITARLIRARDGTQVWSGDFREELKDVFALQDKIAGVVAENLQLTLGGGPRANRPVNPDAYALVLEGRFFWNQRAERPEDALGKAASAFQRALALDANFAEAHAGLADVWVTRGLYRSLDGRGASASEDYAQAKVEAARALELNPALAEPHVTLGYVAYCERQFAESARHYARAFAANPNYALAYHWHGLLVSALGRFGDSLDEVEKSLRLDPLSSNTRWSATMGNFLLGRLAESLIASDRTLALRPGLVPAHGDRALILMQLGRKEEAAAAAREVGRDLKLEPRWWADSDAIYVLRQVGLAAEADEQARRALVEFSADDYRRALIFVAQGRFAEALPAMEKTPTIAVTRIYWHPRWDPFRADPRFHQLLARLGCAEQYTVARETLARVRRQPEGRP